MRRSWLYFASRSQRLSEPDVIWPQFVATAMSAMVASSVSPERWQRTAVRGQSRMVREFFPLWHPRKRESQTFRTGPRRSAESVGRARRCEAGGRAPGGAGRCERGTALKFYERARIEIGR